MKEESQKLLAKAEESLSAGSFLIEEGYFNIAVSRFYYCMFYAAEALLWESGLRFSKHSAVHAAFGERFAKTGRLDPRYHRALISAFDLRILADYAPDEEITAESARELLQTAREFIDQATELIEMENKPTGE